MVNLIRVFCSVIIFLVLSGCMGNVRPDSPKHVKTEKLNDHTGVLVGSFTRIPGQQEHVSHSVFFQQEGQEQLYKISSFHGNDVLGLYPSDDFTQSDRQGILFAFVLPAGDYHFVTYSLESEQGHWKPKKPFSVPFKVEAGRVNYLGDIRIDVHEGKDPYGATIAQGGTFSFINEKTRDMPLLQGKYTNLVWKGDVVATIPTSARENPDHSIASDY